MTTGDTTQLEQRLVRLEQGHTDARDALIEHTCERLRIMARTMLRASPKVRRWTETDDLLQDALVRLHRSLLAVKPTTAREFYGLAATQLRRRLIELARKHYGREGVGKNHLTDDGEIVKSSPSKAPEYLDEWTEFHEQIDRLTEDEREVVHLLWYEGMTQSEAAVVMGISLATLKRRWQSARLKLTQSIQGVRLE